MVTLFMSSSVIFDWFGIREMEGDYVTFIVWSNLIAGVLYLVGSFGLLTSKKWAVWILIATAAFLSIALMGLFIHINYGGSFETKTLGAMMFRIVLTIGFAIHAGYALRNKQIAKAY